MIGVISDSCSLLWNSSLKKYLYRSLNTYLDKSLTTKFGDMGSLESKVWHFAGGGFNYARCSFARSPVSFWIVSKWITSYKIGLKFFSPLACLRPEFPSPAIFKMFSESSLTNLSICWALKLAKLWTSSVAQLVKKVWSKFETLIWCRIVVCRSSISYNTCIFS